MLFNSIDFAVFLPIVFLLYWFVTNRNLKVQNTLLLLASYVFYAWWDWRFLGLIIFSSVVDYTLGLKIFNTDNRSRKKLYLTLSLLINLGFLGFFKYFNFFAESFANAFTFFGSPIEVSQLNIILPVGISFYTFQTLSYTIDIYRDKLKPTESIISFFAFVSFFPQLVAGPIERASNLLPQFFEKRKFDIAQASDGMRQILWGLFKKMVIADNCAEYVNVVYGDIPGHSGSALLLAAIFFSFQIYCDFSGYSDIAIGVSRLFGFRLMRNFAYPYFSRDIAEFWRRWHISLSTWFRDYLYIPLGGSRGGLWMSIRNTFIIFLVSGFWHGANWTFLVWGGLNALYFLPLMLMKKNRRFVDIVAGGSWLPSIKESLMMLMTFSLSVFAWIFFRAESLSVAFEFIGKLFSSSIFQPVGNAYIEPLSLVLIFVVIEWLGRENQFALAPLVKYPVVVRWSIYLFLCVALFIFTGKHQEFIYFQF